MFLKFNFVIPIRYRDLASDCRAKRASKNLSRLLSFTCFVSKSYTTYRNNMAGNGLFYPILGFATCVTFVYMSFGGLWMRYDEPKLSFVETNGTQFFLDGRAFYINGWNSYWLMDHAVDEDNRPRVREMLQAGAKMGLTICRTWAFNDGHYNALQISPGIFNERVFRALDHVIAEARQHGVRLLLSLVNNLKPYGGKTQNYFKNYIRTILTRKNTVTGIEYRNDPTIFAWELMNEPRCISDTSGDTLQDWIEEMSTFVKSIDKNHLVTVGLEGFYGPDNAKKLTVNPEDWASRLGSDFIQNSKISNIDFASVHVYPDQWFHDQEFEDKLKFVSKWMISHIEDGDKELKKPVLFSEYGLSNLNKDFLPSQRDKLYRTVLDVIHKSAKRKHAGAGALVWQFFVEGMDEFGDDFGIVPWERSSTYSLFTQHSCKLAKIQRWAQPEKSLKELCSQRT
ncbi:Mannan endo-1,4-beta-mannosidase [Quillaja saponaria]|uniref:mannan endo-1,4-beta-mannosidase n=1 Tax=Quillaja saponaria TaxID=32244 RepID=A0AAD7KYK9_QUISA|nr:Mannan endo-1,4-beta-mannosidase [Quillaja saponaria]